MSKLELEIKNLKAWIVLPELYEIEIGEWEEDDDCGGLIYHTFYRTYTYTNLFKDYVEKLNVFSLATYGCDPPQITESEYINSYTIELGMEEEYLQSVTCINDVSDLISNNVGDLQEEEGDPDYNSYYLIDEKPNFPYLKRIWRWKPPEGNLEKLILETERELSNEHL